MKPLLALPLLLAAGCGGGATTPSADAPSSIVEVSDAAMLVQDVAALQKEAVVLNFWATWCGPCRAEFPEFVRFDKEHAADNVEVRFVSLDDAADLPAVRQFLDDHGVVETSFLYTGQQEITAQLAQGVGGAIPITMITDGAGAVKSVTVGTTSYAELERRVAAVRRGETPS